jgi:hypothetical protein
MKAITFVSSILFLTFGIIIGVLTLQTDRPFALFSSAQEYKPVYCPINAEIYVYEKDEVGQEIPLSIEKYPDINILAWNVIDGVRPNAQPLYFNELPRMEYLHTADALTFSSLPRSIDVYRKGESTSLKLNYQSDLFAIVKQEINTCSSPTHPHLCNNATLQDDVTETIDLDTVKNISMDCNMTLKAGWVVERRAGKQADPAARTDSALTTTCDLNHDNACNTFDLFIVLDTYGEQGPGLMGDLNNDNKVNALDYTLLTSQISLL